MNRLFSRLLIAVSLSLILFVPQVQAITQNTINCTLSNTWCHYDPSEVCGNGGATATAADASSSDNNNLYVLGDSLLEGAYYVNKYLKKNLGSNGWSVTADASSGRSITTPGSDPTNNRPGHEQPATSAIVTDTTAIHNAGSVVIELGTNSSGDAAAFKGQANDLVDAIEALNPNLDDSNVYWVNVFSDVPQASSYNQALKELANKRSIKIIDTTSVSESGVVHPGPAGYKKFSKIISDSLGHAPQNAAASNAPSPTQPSVMIPTSFTLKDKIGQLLFVGLSDNAEAASLEKKYQVGGFLLNSGSSYDKASIDSIDTGSLKPFIAVDEEGGQVDRLNLNPPSAKQLGQMSDSAVKQKAADIGKKMSDLSISVDFAPVADLDNGRNTAISKPDRSFSSKPETVASKAGAFADGLKQSGVIPTFKHFPGLGNATGSTGGNTDTGSATTPDLSSLKGSDLKPYKDLLNDSDQSMVMMGNQIVPGLTGGNPASLSKNAYDLLRDDYGFDGLIVTDEIGHAKAIAQSPSAAVIKAIDAGADMPLFNADSEAQVGSIIDAVAQAVNDGTLTKNQIDDAVSKVASLKNNGQSDVVPVAHAAACQCPASDSDTTTLVGSDHEKQAFNFFHQTHGLSVFVSAVIVGVLEGESGAELSPTAYNSQYGAYGIAQWAFGRKEGPRSLTEFAAKQGKPVSDFATQLAYVWEEISGGSGAATNKSAGLTTLKGQTDIDTAVYAWEDYYETSGHGNMGPRYAGAHRLVSNTPDGSGSTSAGDSSSNDCASAASSTDSGAISDYKNPLRDVQNLVPRRIDQGVDYRGSGPVYAMGSGKVLNVHNDGWTGIGSTPTFIVYKLDAGPAKGKYVFFAEGCDPKVSINDPVTSSTVICNMLSGNNSVETGWANGAVLGEALAHDLWVGHDSTHYYTAYGQNFSQLLEKLGAPGGTIEAGGQKLGDLPTGWPSW